MIDRPPMRLPVKGTDESVVLGFDFSDEAVSVSSATLTVTVEPGVAEDPTPASILTGAYQIDPTNAARVLQRVSAGVDQVDYYIKATAPGNGADILTRGAILPVRSQV